MKTEGNRRHIDGKPAFSSGDCCWPLVGRLTFEVPHGGNQKYELCSTNKPVEMRINCAKSLFLYQPRSFVAVRWSQPEICMHTQASGAGANPINCLILPRSHAGNGIKRVTACNQRKRGDWNRNEHRLVEMTSSAGRLSGAHFIVMGKN